MLKNTNIRHNFMFFRAVTPVLNINKPFMNATVSLEHKKV